MKQGGVLFRKDGAKDLQPALIPLVLVVERNLRRDPEQASALSNQWCFSPLSNTLWGTIATALILAFILSKWTLLSTALSIVPVTFLLLVYVALIPRTFTDSLRLPQIDIEETVVPLSCRTLLILIAALGVETVLFGFPSGIYLPSILSGIAKALSWYCTIQAVCDTRPNNG